MQKGGSAVRKILWSTRHPLRLSAPAVKQKGHPGKPGWPLSYFSRLKDDYLVGTVAIV